MAWLLALAVSVAAEVAKTAEPARNGQNDEVGQFLAVVLAQTEDFWSAAFKAAGGPSYEEPKLVLFTGMILTACGPASGTSYCAQDHRIYLDPAFPDLPQLAKAGDFAKALIVAREVGHHVQNIAGLPRLKAAGDSQEAAIIRSEQVELQADCFAGLWSRYVQGQHLLEDTDLTEARDLLRSLGDDRVDNVSASPTAKRYGTSEQRIRWYDKGLAGGAIADCDTTENPL